MLMTGADKKQAVNKKTQDKAGAVTGTVKLPAGLYALLLSAAILISCLPQASGQLPWQSSFRKDQVLNDHWVSIADSSGSAGYAGFEKSDFDASGWEKVDLPHNWDRYQGYIRLKHGNLHGDAWYRKTFRAEKKAGQSSFLFFEGVSSYATVYLNGHRVGSHAGGRTSFSINVTRWLNGGDSENLLAVKVRHPAGIRDLPWVCGGCSDEV